DHDVRRPEPRRPGDEDQGVYVRHGGGKEVEGAGGQNSRRRRSRPAGLAVMAVRPSRFNAAGPAPFRLAMLVIDAAVAMAAVAVLRRPAHVVGRLLALMAHAKARRVAAMALARLAKARHAIDRLPVNVVRPS